MPAGSPAHVEPPITLCPLPPSLRGNESATIAGPPPEALLPALRAARGMWASFKPVTKPLAARPDPRQDLDVTRLVQFNGSPLGGAMLGPPQPQRHPSGEPEIVQEPRPNREWSQLLVRKPLEPRPWTPHSSVWARADA